MAENKKEFKKKWKNTTGGHIQAYVSFYIILMEKVYILSLNYLKFICVMKNIILYKYLEKKNLTKKEFNFNVPYWDPVQRKIRMMSLSYHDSTKKLKN